MHRAAAFTVAAATSLALTAGMTGPAVATGTGGGSIGPGAARAEGNQRIPLITGDRVVVGAGGQVVGFEPAKGRERIPVQVRRGKDHTLVLPADAQGLVARGRLDQRLFDVTELSDAQLRRSHGDGLKLIVEYEGGAAAARAGVRAAGDTRVSRTFPALNADAVRASRDGVAKVWEALTDQRRGVRSTASGIGKVWLDGVRRASLDKSVKQIGADKAWQAGYDGKGVKIAVLDTGVDKTHDDLKDQVVGEKNFSTSADAVDRVGHGTHVASIAAGTGAKSGGKYRGVAPGAKVISGKVLDDQGYGDESGIIAGMEWAAAEGADVVNLSLGGGDTPGVDPMEETVNRLSAEKGLLFAIAAGNEGDFGDSTVGSPGSADAALTVGAVDKDDKLASFSSKGPRVGDGAIKPDVTAPGVDITAAAAPGTLIDSDPGVPHPAPGYLSISGTSMATPHAAGAAAILKQQHLGWKSADLKGALTASAKDGGYTAFQQGSGRIQVDRAIAQSVIADPVSVSLGVAQWPHTDDQPVSKKVGYRNLGTTDVTLDLSVAALDPTGKPAPAGFFTLGATKVTVPAGGRAEVGLTADTRLGGDTDGSYSAYVTATGGGQSVRTAAAVVREVESYDLTVRHLGADGKDTTTYFDFLVGLTGNARGYQAFLSGQSGPVKIRVPKGRYVLNGSTYLDPSSPTGGVAWLARPDLTVTGDTTVTSDARTAKPVDITVPGLSTTDFAGPGYDVNAEGNYTGFGWFLDNYTGFRSAHLGPAVSDGSLQQTWDGHFLKDATTQYSVMFGGKTRKLATGYTKHVKAGELATLKTGLGASVPGKESSSIPFGWLPGAVSTVGFTAGQAAPGVRTVHLSTGDGIQWEVSFEQRGEPDPDGWPTSDAYYVGQKKHYRAGRTYHDTFNTAVFGPVVGRNEGVFRTAPDPVTGDQRIYGSLSLLADGAGHPGFAAYTAAKSTLYRNGVKVGENTDPLSGQETFPVTGEAAEYRLTSTIERSLKAASVSSRVDVSFTFRSKQVAAPTALPVSTVRFAAPVDLTSRAEAGKRVSVPVVVQGAAAGKNLKSLTVYVSYDSGKTWKAVQVRGGKISVKNPAKDKGISLRAKVTDKKGNKSEVTIRDAYFGK
ncbi:S8 family serine peptidase [Streptomyces sp. NPDC001941]|uniref:S8 family peptidase n=1 Tax=Streptomyces sp. NPDC001941 TaxID=3154659 RepID=UPI00332FAC3F